MKKKIFFTILMAILVSIPLALSSLSAQAADKPIKLSVAHFWPSTHFVEAEQVKQWTAEIEKACKSKVKLVSYPGQTLLTMRGIYDGVEDGVADIGIGSLPSHMAAIH